MDELTGAVIVKGNHIPAATANEVEQYLNDQVARELYAKYGVALRVHLTFSEVTASR